MSRHAPIPIRVGSVLRIESNRRVEKWNRSESVGTEQTIELESKLWGTGTGIEFVFDSYFRVF
jgi:hypothetical protein